MQFFKKIDRKKNLKIFHLKICCILFRSHCTVQYKELSLLSHFSTLFSVQFCNVEEGGYPWQAYHWLFTPFPGVFGLIGGYANPSGVALIIVFTIMTVCSMPFVRKSGYFQARRGIIL